MKKIISAIRGFAYGKKNKKGFSLIELIIVMSIISIMTVVGVISIQSRRTTTQLETSAREVTAAIREAQNNALTGKNANSETGCVVYNFVYEANDPNYRVGGPLGSEDACPSADYILKNDVVFTGSGSVSFSIPFGYISTTSQQIQLNKGSYYYYVCIDNSGNIYEKKDGCP